MRERNRVDIYGCLRNCWCYAVQKCMCVFELSRKHVYAGASECSVEIFLLLLPRCSTKFAVAWVWRLWLRFGEYVACLTACRWTAVALVELANGFDVLLLNTLHTYTFFQPFSLLSNCICYFMLIYFISKWVVCVFFFFLTIASFLPPCGC